MNLSKDVLKKIKKDHITPTPAWHFWVKNGAFWFIFGLCALAGSKAIAMTIFALTETDFELLMRFTHHPLRVLHRIFPSGWIILFLLFVILAMLGLQHTKKGYKLGLKKLIGINLLISLVIGTGAYAIGTAEHFEYIIERHASFLPHHEEHRRKAWTEPEEGRLAGMIVSIQDEEILLLDDFNQKQWVVEYDDSEIRGPVELKEGEKIRLGGELIDENTFEAEIIAPWRKPKGHKRRGKIRGFKKGERK